MVAPGSVNAIGGFFQCPGVASQLSELWPRKAKQAGYPERFAQEALWLEKS
jgi:hypothetical protein